MYVHVQGFNQQDRATMSIRGLVIGVVLVLAFAAAAALLLRDMGRQESRMTIGGEPLTGGPVLDAGADTIVDPTQEYIRRLGRPDTAAMAVLDHDIESDSAGNSPLPGPPVGARAPAFSLPTVDGGTFRLADTRNRVAVLNFWATWCEPCRDEIPALITLQEDLHDRGLRIVGISIEENSREAVESFVETFPFNYPLLVEGRSVAEEYGAHFAVPTTVVINRQGRIAARLYGALHRDSLESHVRPLLAGR